MTNKFFTNCNTLEDLKKEYKKLLFQYHPDCNRGTDTTATCQLINAEYDKIFIKLKDTHATATGTTYTSTTASEENVNEFKDIINAIIHFTNIKIEIIGSWIWITGDTKPYKEDFKKLKFSWSDKKTAWYFHKEGFKKKSKNQYNMEGLRNLFGSQEVKTQSQFVLV